VADSGGMTGAGGWPGQGAGAGRRWDVALSFAGAQRGYVEQVAGASIQYASRECRTVRIPASTWDTALTHVLDPADAIRLAGNAKNRRRG
jgi:hypothetical protein